MKQPLGFSIHVMQLEDFQRVTDLWKRSEGVGLNELDTRENITRFFARNPGMSFVARSGDGETIGAVLSGHDGRRGYMHHLAVEKSQRGKGIGKALVEACFTALRAAGITRCNIFIYADNEAGKQFWLHNGWNERAELRLMQKPLA